MENYNKLVALANIYARQYYYIGHSDISDVDYDNLVANIEVLEVNQGFSSDISPTQRVGWYERLSSGCDLDFTHKYQKCLSLENIRTSIELTSFLGKDSEIVVTPKLDGCAGMLYYSSGLLTNIVTRGDGTVGKDITHLQSYIEGIPSSIIIMDDVRIEGEFLCPNFTIADGKNQRNFVAGSLGIKNTKDLEHRGISFESYNMVFEDELKRPDTYIKVLSSLKDAGMSCIEFIIVKPSKHSPEELKDIFSAKYKYTDGLVYKVNPTKKWNEFTRHHPKFAVAYKFKETQYQTKLIGVQWQVGKSRQITPVAILEPVDIEGTTVQRASLANKMNIKARSIKLFDVVNVIRAGSVIPQVVSVYKEAEDRQDIECTVCPSCYSELEDRNGLLFCLNKSCSDARQKFLEGFISILVVKGIGPATVSKLNSTGAVSTAKDFFHLTKKVLVEDGGVSPKLVDNILKNIDDAKKKPRCVLWAALGIPRLGTSVAETIMQKYNSLARLTVTELSSIPRIGDKTAMGIVMWVRDNRALLEDLEEMFSTTTINITAGTVVLTGTMDRPRTVIAEILKAKGWRISTSVSGKVDLLLYGTNPGSKLDRARTLKIKTLDYFSDMSILD